MSDDVLGIEIDELRMLLRRLRRCIERGRSMNQCSHSRAVCNRAEQIADDIEHSLDRLYWNVPLPPPSIG